MYDKRFFTPVSISAFLLLAALLSGCYTAQKSTKPPSLQDIQFRREVVQYALSLKGSGYKYAGKNPRTGFDCSGLTSYVLKQFNIPVSSSSAAQAQEGKATSLKAVLPGDLVVFGKNRNNIQHVAMVVEQNRSGIVVVHSTTSRGVIQENISTSTYWEPRILWARDVISGR